MKIIIVLTTMLRKKERKVELFGVILWFRYIE